MPAVTDKLAVYFIIFALATIVLLLVFYFIFLALLAYKGHTFIASTLFLITPTLILGPIAYGTWYQAKTAQPSDIDTPEGLNLEVLDPRTPEKKQESLPTDSGGITIECQSPRQPK